MRCALALLLLASSVASANENPLKEAARQAWLLAFSQGGDVTRARAEIALIAARPSDERKLAARLADLFSEHGKDRDSTYLWRGLIAEQPNAVEAALYQARIVEAALRQGSRSKTSIEVAELVRTFQRVDRPGNAEQQDTLATARDLAERELSMLAINYHRERPDFDVDAANKATDGMYAAYLTLFPTGSKAYALRFYWAEFLYEQVQAFERAADQYTLVLMADVAAETPGRFMEKAAFNAVLAREQIVQRMEARR